MCFPTANRRVGVNPWQQTTAWKVLRRFPDGKLESEYQNAGTTVWTPGKIQRAKGRNFRDQWGDAKAGIYVFRNRSQAARYHFTQQLDGSQPTIVRVLVSPKDFLHKATYLNRATYRQVRLDPKTPKRPRNPKV